MVAYSFQPMFVEPTWSGRKKHTIRNERGGRGHVRPSERIHHYTGMRTKSCKLFALSICDKVLPIRMRFEEFEVVTIGVETMIKASMLDRFAQSDGFDNWEALRGFWRKHHPRVVDYSGVIIYWRDMEPVR